MSLDETNTASKNGNYNSIKTDAEALLRLVNKYVKIQLIRDTEILGFVHSIDPVHHSIIMILPEEDTYTVKIILGHAILEVVETYPVPDWTPPLLQMETQPSDDIEMRKKKLISWFKMNLLPVTESGQKILFKNVSILPPYGLSNICTNKPIVAMQLRKIIQDMPEDFVPIK